MARAYEPVIGLEIHAQLLTQSKLFCGCSTNFGQPPNSNICPVCLGLPGALPVLNERAARLAVRAALALNCRIVETSIFARKNYFYPDLPKGYQISQYELPFSEQGWLDIELDGTTKRAGITRVHMEEDAGKNVHGVGGDSVVDLNRAGTPLVEIVGEPDLRSSVEAAAFMRAVRDILVFIGVNDGNLEEGSLRCDANVSLRPVGQSTFGTRVELKNINSFRFVQRAIDAEILRQTTVLDGGGQVVQETRSFDPETGKTASLRSKEEAHDYRYFPDPDLPPVVVDAALVAEERAAMGELPAQVRSRFVSDLRLSEAAAQLLTQHPGYVRLFEAVRAEAAGVEPRKIANFVQTEVLRAAKLQGQQASFSVNAKQVGELLCLLEEGSISGKQAKEVFALVENTQLSPRAVVAERGMGVVSDAGALEAVLREIMGQNPKQVESLRAGKRQVTGFFVGQVMKATQGSADPKLVGELLERLLAES